MLKDSLVLVMQIIDWVGNGLATTAIEHLDEYKN